MQLKLLQAVDAHFFSDYVCQWMTKPAVQWVQASSYLFFIISSYPTLQMRQMCQLTCWCKALRHIATQSTETTQAATTNFRAKGEKSCGENCIRPVSNLSQHLRPYVGISRVNSSDFSGIPSYPRLDEHRLGHGQFFCQQNRKYICSFQSCKLADQCTESSNMFHMFEIAFCTVTIHLVILRS